MTPKQATADVFYTALKAMPKSERDEVLARIAGDKALRRDLFDLAVFESREHEPSRSFRQAVDESKSR
jgi:hypothetical protein